MISWRRLRTFRSKRMQKALFGLTTKEMNNLYPAFEAAFEKAQWSGKFSDIKPNQRIRAVGAGKKRVFKRKNLFLVVLFYIKNYPTFDVLAALSNMSRTAAHEWVHRLYPVLTKALGIKQALPSRRGRNFEALKKACPDCIFLIDGAERPMCRPKNSTRQKNHYSGKKKRHTVKNIVVCRQDRYVLFLGKTFPGKMHDMKIHKKHTMKFPQGSIVYQDSGFQGHDPPGVKIYQPVKKERGMPRRPEDKIYNKEVSSVRVRVEHAIGGIKHSRSVSDVFRNRKKGFEDKVMMLATGLHNYKVMMRG